jgi:parvulin-like peptidyl-prolyl isomerase
MTGVAPSGIVPARSFVLMGAGAVVGLTLAGYALFTAKGTSTLAVPPEDVALVNQQPVSRVDYIAQLQAVYGVDLAHATDDQKRKVLNEMIREELFVQRGKELDVASVDPEVRAAMVNAVEQMAAADAISAVPSDAKLRAWYDAHRDRYSSEGRMIAVDYVFPAGTDDAADAARAITSGASASEAAARFHGRNSGKVNGEEFYFAAKIHLGDQLFAVARGLPDGGVSAPVPMPDGVHVIVMSRNLAPVPIDFAAARDQVLSDYRADAIKRVTHDDEIFLRKRANILVSEDVK